MRRHAADADWAFHASNAAVIDSLAAGRHLQSLREYFGAAAFEELSVLARAAKQARKRRALGPRVLIVPGMMGSRLCELAPRTSTARRSRVLWIDPERIAAGHLKNLKLPSARSIRPKGVMLPSYAKLALTLAAQGFAPEFVAYDWRLGIDTQGARLASSIAAGGKPALLIAHSMGALVARIAAQRLPKRLVRKIVMLGAPNQGAFAPVLALRGTYPFVQKLSRLDLKHSAHELASKVFCTFPGLYQMLPPDSGQGAVDLLDVRNWPSTGPRPDAKLLKRAALVRAAMAPPDARMVQIVGVNRETVIAVRPTATGFEYESSLNGDGTVPVRLALLPGLKSYFADEAHGNLPNNQRIIEALLDLIGGESTRRLSGQFEARDGGSRRVDDARLEQMIDGAKIDWRQLDSLQRGVVLADLDGGREENLAGSAPSLA